MFLLFIYWQDSPSFRDELKAMLEASGVREYFRYAFIYLDPHHQQVFCPFVF